jgi:hypothetical protein
MVARPPSPAELAYRRTLARLRAGTAARAAAEFRESIDEADIAGSYAAFASASSPTIEAGQAVAQSLSTAYLEQLGADVVDELDDIVGTTKAGKSIAEGLAPFGPMMLALIANGRTVGDALEYGETLVSGFTDREVTAAADRETEHQVGADPASWRWEGIVQPGSCDACQANEGIHDAEEPIYRHNDCQCDQRWIPAPSLEAAPA